MIEYNLPTKEDSINNTSILISSLIEPTSKDVLIYVLYLTTTKYKD